jgi:hypothetical protein
VPGPFDLAFAVLFAGMYPLWEARAAWPRLRAAIAAGEPGALVRGYRFLLAAEWLAVAVLAVRWLDAGRSWAELGLAAPVGWRLAAGVALVLGSASFVRAQVRAAGRLRPDRRAAVLQRFASLVPVLPRTRGELRWCMAVSITAGVCEELLFRGFLVWTLRPFLGVWMAAAATAVLFGLGHAYQGRQGIVRTTLGGVLFGGVALLTHSLLPGMAVHALADLGSAATGYALLRPLPSAGVADIRVAVPGAAA